MTSLTDTDGGRYAEIVNKAIGDLTPGDFEYLRREDPALAETRSREYSKWWAGTHGAVRAARPAAAATPRSLADQLQREVPPIGADEDLSDWIRKHERAPAPLYVFDVVLKVIRQVSETHKAETQALKARIAELEARKTGVKYMGVYRPGLVYEPDEATTWGGNLYIARERTTAKPGEDGTMARAWQLAVRRGNDGRNCPNCKPTRGNGDTDV